MESQEFNINELIEKTKTQNPTEAEVKVLCRKTTESLVEEPNVLQLNAPITVCGDIHGQFDDLLQLFNTVGWPPETTYLFLGDYVDRGYHSIRCITLLFALKIQYPNKIFLLRGKHETKQITQIYGFYDECKHLYHEDRVWQMFTDAFDFLPLAAVLNNKIYCVHGGLSPSLTTIDDISNIQRRQEPSTDGPMCDMLFCEIDNDTTDKPFAVGRGVANNFCVLATEQWLKNNNFSLILRSELYKEGYKWSHGEKVLSIFSAPNYCYRTGNKGVIAQVQEDLSIKIVEVAHVPPILNEERKL